MLEEITQETYDNIASLYSANTLFPAFRKIIEEAAKAFLKNLPLESKILILGCGDGRDAEIFAKAGHHVTLVDFSENMLKIAREKLPSADFYLQDFRQLDFSKDSFDGVWASTCLYHVQKKFIASIFDKIFLIIRNNGVFYFNLKQGMGERLIEKPTSYPSGGARFYSFYSKAEVFNLINKFELIEFRDEHPEIDIHYFQTWLRK